MAETAKTRPPELREGLCDPRWGGDLMATLGAVQRERDEYASSICFETTCTNCAHMLDVLAGSEELERADGIEAAKTRRIRTQQQALVDLRADRTHYRQVIDEVIAYVDDPGNWSALDGRRTHLLALLAPTTDPRRTDAATTNGAHDEQD